ncbi:MAG TPA: hypothetical protein VE282_01275, partial [Gemmatimonadales bacterium]|nr:hypothetical protein [Gemmatimonadales bacterium]
GSAYPADFTSTLFRNTTVSAESSVPHTTPASPPELGRTFMAILATMVLLIVALAGVLVETTWRNPQSTIEVLTADPGSFARR